MEVFFYSFLFLFWTLFWSFSSVIIYRLKSWEKWIITWRSKCWKCKKTLWFWDLIPLISWLKSWWRCSGCEKKVSIIYPFLELSMGILFTLIWYFLIDLNLLLEANSIEIIKLLFWLFIAFISVVYVFYDILFMEINESVFGVWIWVVFVTLILQTLFNNFYILETLPSWWWFEIVLIPFIAIIISSLILWWLYSIMIKWLSEIIDVLIIVLSGVALLWFKNLLNINLTDFPVFNWIIWAMWIFIFFFFQILISNWKWMWWWDLRIAIFIWLMLWAWYSVIWVMSTYLIWTIISLSLILVSKFVSKKKKKKFSSEIPFWPFLALWFFTTLFWWEQILNFINIYIQ